MQRTTSTRTTTTSRTNTSNGCSTFAKRTMLPNKMHRFALCLTVVLLSSGTPVAKALNTQVSDFRLTLEFLGGANFKCFPSDAEFIRASAEDCLELAVATCGISTTQVSLASSECDAGGAALIRGGYFVTTGTFPPSPGQVEDCLDSVFKLQTCLEIFEVTYPFVDKLKLSFDVPMPTAAPSQAPSKSAAPTVLPSQSPSALPTSKPTTFRPTLGPSLVPTVSPTTVSPTTVSPTTVSPTTVSPTTATFTTASPTIVSYVGVSVDADGQLITDASAAEREPIYGNGVGSPNDGANVAAIAGSIAGAALLVVVLALFARSRRKQKAWLDGAVRDTTTLDEHDIEADIGAGLGGKDSLGLAPRDASSDTGSSLLGRMLASSRSALASISDKTDECTPTQEEEDEASVEQKNEPSTKIVPVSILRQSKKQKDLNTMDNNAEDASLRTVVPFITPVKAAQKKVEHAATPETVALPESPGSPDDSYSLMGRLACAMHPFHCLAPGRGVTTSQDQFSETSDAPYEPDSSWDPDDSSLGDGDAVDAFQTTGSLLDSDNKRLLADQVSKKTFKMQRLRIPAEPDTRRPKFYL